MSLASNIYAEVHGTKFSLEDKLQPLRDSVERFNEIDCASFKSALGRYSAKDTINVIKSYSAAVRKQLA